MKSNYLAIVILTLVFVSPCIQAEQPPATAQPILDKTILFDGKVNGVWFPWIKNEARYQYVGIRSLSCAHLSTGSADHPDWAHLKSSEAANLQCVVSVVGLDFATASLLVFIDMVQKFAVTDASGNTKNVWYPIARYPAAISGQTKDFLAGFRPPASQTPTPLESLGAVMNELARSVEGLGQERFLEGEFTVTPKGSKLMDPEALDLPTPEEQNRYLQHAEGGAVRFEVQRKSSDVKNYPKPKDVYAALTQTLEILKKGYQGLKASSQEPEKQAFRDLIAKNATVISTELRTAIALMSKQSYHPMEIIHFVNQVSNTIWAIDTILGGAAGSSPEMYQLINGIRARK